MWRQYGKNYRHSPQNRNIVDDFIKDVNRTHTEVYAMIHGELEDVNSFVASVSGILNG